MKIGKGTNSAVLDDMANIMESEDMKTLFAFKKEAQQTQTGGEFASDGVHRNLTQQEHLDIARQTPEGKGDDEKVRYLTPTLQKLVNDPSYAMMDANAVNAARRALSGKPGPSDASLLARFFPQEQNLQAALNSFKNIANPLAPTPVKPGTAVAKPSTPTGYQPTYGMESTSSAITELVKMGEVFAEAGFIKSEALVGELLKTITVEARKKVVEELQKGKKGATKKDEKCPKCKKDSKKCECKGKDGKSAKKPEPEKKDGKKPAKKY